LRLGVLAAQLDDPRVEPEVAAVVRRALEVLQKAGMVLSDRDATPLAELNDCLIDILLVEAWEVHGERVQAEPEHFGATTLRLLLEGAEAAPERADAARARRAELLPAATALLDGIDVLVGPAVAYPAPEQNPPVDTPEGEIEGLFTGAYNVSGQPALVLPCGLTSDGLPVGLQLAAGVGADAALLWAAAAIEAVLAAS
jgi:aspartyl-tRNA(Asn)/glutamyl-tRNA(Gln) amidotransferase subunit A